LIGQQSGSWPKQTEFNTVGVQCVCAFTLWVLHRLTHAMNSHAEHMGRMIARNRFNRECRKTIFRTIANEYRYDNAKGVLRLS